MNELHVRLNNFEANRYICAWLLEVEAAVVTSWRVLFVMPSQNIAKLIGFTMDDDPIVVVDIGHEIVHTLQVYDRPSQQFHTLGIIEERVRQLIRSPGASSTLSFSPGTSSTPNFSPTPPTPPNYYGGSSSNTECSNCKHLFGRIKVLQATLEMYMHPEQHILDSTALLHDLNNDMENIDSIFRKFSITARCSSGMSLHFSYAFRNSSLAILASLNWGFNVNTKIYAKIIEDVGEDDDFNSGAWVIATNYVIAFGGTVTGCLGDIDNFLIKGKLDHIVAIVKSCSLNMLGDLNVTLKDISGTIPGTIHHKVMVMVVMERILL
ncbi:transposase, MuDR, MULE transposase domain protein [Tanacetum coccineum]